MEPFDIRPLGSSFGAEITGIDVRTMDDPAAAALHAAIDAHRVVVIRGQSLSPEAQKRFSRRLGPLVTLPYVKPLDGHPEVIAVLKEADEVKVSTFGSWWHADFSYLEEPPVYSILHALELPPKGGDTLFADLCTAYDALSSGMRRMLDPLQVMHSGFVYGTRTAVDGERGRARGVVISRGNADADVERAHPLVRFHAPTGRKALFASPTYTTRLADMTAEESRPLLEFLYGHMARPEYTLRQRWQPGDLLVWDNRAVNHLAVNDYDGYRRLLHRTTAGRERPAAAPT
ncbi:MAG: TauD/TfdA family dioxygenase [Alphaproteobacteria bacterium]|nr:TauD/TfdA family dioxygenase [Alphaproteobacteria bacterium]